MDPDPISIHPSLTLPLLTVEGFIRHRSRSLLTEVLQSPIWRCTQEMRRISFSIVARSSRIWWQKSWLIGMLYILIPLATWVGIRKAWTNENIPRRSSFALKLGLRSSSIDQDRIYVQCLSCLLTYDKPPSFDFVCLIKCLITSYRLNDDVVVILFATYIVYIVRL